MGAVCRRHLHNASHYASAGGEGAFQNAVVRVILNDLGSLARIDGQGECGLALLLDDAPQRYVAKSAGKDQRRDKNVGVENDLRSCA